jgi:outer membrane protein OmpA-like peptidoglycan-associated protein
MRISTIGGLSLALVAGCATAPPPELREARAEYQRARTGAAAQLAPAQLGRAANALSQAEQAFADNPDHPLTRDLAYAARREAEVAESAARSVEESQRQAAAMASVDAAQRRLAEGASSAEERARLEAIARAEADRARALQAQEATQAREQATHAREQATQAEQQATQARQQADEAARQRQLAEQQAQEERAARQRTEAALQRVEQFATVRNEVRGRVITLNGSVLFTTGTAELLPAARLRLDEVAQALQTEPGAQFTVEGFTDSRGSKGRNLDLSEARADAVRDYLVNRGVPENRIRAIGRGEEQPVATNATPDGRANNRRVEIIISRRQAER